MAHDSLDRKFMHLTDMPVPTVAPPGSDPAAPASARPARWRTLVGPLALVLLAILPGITVLGHMLVQDDIPLILQNPNSGTLDGLWRAFARPFWPPPWSPDLYRPLTSILLTLEWTLGVRRPGVVHLTGLLLYAACALAFYGLLRTRLPRWAAWIAAALFAVHPVHVEAVDVAINQSELLVGLASALAVTLYVRGRDRGALSVRTQLGIAGLYLVACLSKESGVMLPALLAAAELFVVRDETPLLRRLTALRPFVLGLAAIGLGFIAARTQVLGGDAVGTFTAEGLVGLTMGQRALTMLGVVVDWARLLVWPAHLQADYSPHEIVGATTWGWAQNAGLAILLATVFAAWRTRRTAPLVTFGILWMAVALFPVHNVLIPTGIVLAERTLFLPSMGALFIVAALLPAVGRQLADVRPVVRYAAGATLVAVLAAGAARTYDRQEAWSTPFMHASHLLIDAPTSWRTHYAVGQILWEYRKHDESMRHLLEAMRLHPPAIQVHRDLGDHYRQNRDCVKAGEHYREVLKLAPGLIDVRSSYIACLLWLGDYRTAAFQARMAQSYSYDVRVYARFRSVADSARAVNAPPGTVAVAIRKEDQDSSLTDVRRRH